MTRKILVADLLCGAGGSSTGCERALTALGLNMELVCVNHWPVAIETHTKNHPEARHYVQDIATVRPHLIVPEGYLDLLMASPTCTHHSVARGGKPTSDQQRSDPWHIVTWLTELDVKRIIIENVWEFCGWGPVDPKTGKPIKSKKGEYFQAWIDVIRKLGYEPEWRKLNAANYGDATTRQRFILKARKDRKLVSWAPLTHAKRTDDLVLFPTLKPWRPAREIIDWQIKGKSIFARKKPLAPKTLARIYAGAVKFHWPEPFLTLLLREIEHSLLFHIRWFFKARNKPRKAALRAKARTVVRDYIARLRHFRIAPHEYGRGGRSAEAMLITLRRNADGRSVKGPLPTIAANGTHIAIAEPVIINVANGNEAHEARPNDRRALSVDQPLGTIHAGGGNFAVAEPIVVNMKGKSTASSSEEPLPTQTSHAAHLFAAEPIILSQQNSGAARSTDEPLPTITTGGAGSDKREGCARPMIAEPVIVNGRKNNQAKGVSTEPVPTLDTKGGVWLAEPFVLSRQGGGAARSTDEPTPAQVAKHSHVLISPYYGSGSGETCKSAEEPLDTVTAKARFGMVVPVTHSKGGNGARDVEEPIPTLTTAKGGEFAIVMPVTHAGGFERAQNPGDDPLPTITGANRGELAVITAQHGERDGQAPRVHSVDDPVPTIAASGHVDLAQGVVTPVFDGQHYDILFRMLEPHELAAAMGFTTDEATYEFAGTKTEQIKQIGNAVSVAMMQAEVSAIMADAAPKRKSAEPQQKITQSAA